MKSVVSVSSSRGQQSLVLCYFRVTGPKGVLSLNVGMFANCARIDDLHQMIPRFKQYARIKKIAQGSFKTERTHETIDREVTIPDVSLDLLFVLFLLNIAQKVWR